MRLKPALQLTNRCNTRFAPILSIRPRQGNERM
nr:MAG TPA: hypothetical protein [Microviridae sp.]